MTARSKSGRKPKSPAFQFYAGDYLTDAKILHLTFEQRGLWLHLISLSWLNGPLEDDAELLALQCGITRREFERLWNERLQACFERRDGSLSSPRLERERISQAENRERRMVASAKGNGARYGRVEPSESEGNRSATGDHAPPDSRASGAPNGIAPVSRLPSPGSVPSERATASPPRAARASRAKVDKPPNPDHAPFVAWWSRAFESATGAKYPFAGGKDAKHVERILERVGLDEAQRLATKLLVTPPGWAVKDGGGVDLGTLERLLAQLASAGTLETASGSRQLALHDALNGVEANGRAIDELTGSQRLLLEEARRG